MEHIINNSFEHLSPLIDLWEDKHLYTDLSSPSGTLFEYEPFNYAANSFIALDIANCVDDTDVNSYNQFHKQMAHPSDVYNTNIPSPCIHDINESDEFWKDIVNNVDHNILEENCSDDYCNSITDILSFTPLAETNDLNLKLSQETLDSSFLLDITKTDNVDRQDSNVNNCCLDSNKTIQEKVSFVYCDCASTGCETDEEFGKKSMRNKISTSFLPLTSPELNFITFDTEDNNFTNTEMKQTNQACFVPRTSYSHFLVDKKDSSKEMPQSTASIGLRHNLNSAFTKTVLNCSNVILGPESELKFDDKIQNLSSDTIGSVIPKNGYKLMDFTKTMPQNKSFVRLECCPDPAFLNTDSNCTNMILNPKLDFHDKMNIVFAEPRVISETESKRMQFTETVSSKTHEASGEKRKPNRVSKCKSVSSIKIDKKGSFLSLPTNSLSTLMVKDLLQMSGSKTERSIKELTMEYRANFVKILQQKQLRLKRADAMS